MFGGAACTVAADAASSAPSEDVGVYFGQGCFWHVQSDFIEKEQTSLGRRGDALTSLAGYAGGPSTEGPVCYHNYSGKPDYSTIGFAEVVGMQIPRSVVGDFAKFYFDSVSKGNSTRPILPIERPFRNVMGLPGGMMSPLYPAVEAANLGRMQLVAGGANEIIPGDRKPLEKQIVYIYDSQQFPFKPAEVYHQFREDTSMKDLMLAEKRIFRTGCPEDPLKDERIAST